jgi:hypothetical protein
MKMAHTIEPGPRPNIKIMRLSGELSSADMHADEALGLNEGVPVYVLLDGRQMALGLPEGFLDGAKNSYFTNPNLAFLAVVLNNEALKLVAKMVSRLTRRRDKLDVFDNEQQAMAHLLRLTD